MSLERVTSTQPAPEADEVTSSTYRRPGIHFDPDYVKTLPCWLKLLQAGLSLIGFICAQTIRTSVYRAAGGWYTFVSMPAFLISSVFIICYLFHVVERFKGFPWLITEMAYAIAWCILFFIAACISATRVRVDPPWGAATFFGFLAMAVFGYEAFWKYKQWKRDEPAQGAKSITDTSTGTDPNAF